jgi:hypothetical protein
MSTEAAGCLPLRAIIIIALGGTRHLGTLPWRGMG